MLGKGGGVEECELCVLDGYRDVMFGNGNGVIEVLGLMFIFG